jgi:hypothetical protein
MQRRHHAFAAAGATLVACAWLWAAPGAPATPPSGGTPESMPDELRRGRVPPMLLSPLPRAGGVARMAPPRVRPGTPADWARFDAAFATIRAKHFGAGGSERSRAAGCSAIRECRDPAAFESMYGALRAQRGDVKMAMLDAFASGGAEGEYAIASVAIQDTDKAVRAEATRRLGKPPSPAVLAAIDDGLRATDHEWINNAGVLAGALHAVEAIPQLIFSQYVSARTEGPGDRAWIAIGKTTSYVQNVIPVVGDNSGAFQPIIGQIIEGVVLRVNDCSATVYHGGVHDSLVAMTTYDSGTQTAGIGWDIRDWAKWFDGTYVPLKRAQDEELAKASVK